MNTITILILGILAAVILLGIVFVIRKFGGVDIVNVTNSIVTFIQSALISAGITTVDDMFNTIVNYIVEALTTVAAGCSNAVTTDEKVTQALSLINDYASAAGITFTDVQIATIKTVLTVGFEFVDALSISRKKLAAIKGRALTERKLLETEQRLLRKIG